MDLYVGKPYSFRNYNCWDHAAKVRSDNNIKTQAFKAKTIDNAFKVITAEMQKIGHGLTKVDSPINFDIAIVHKKQGERFVYHCGVYFDGGISHASRQLGQVVYEPLTEFKKGFEGVVFWR